MRNPPHPPTSPDPQAAVASMHEAEDLPEVAAVLCRRLAVAGCDVERLSVYLFAAGDAAAGEAVAGEAAADHYYLLPRPVGCERLTLAADAAELRAHTTGRSIVSGGDDGRMFVVPTCQGAMTAIIAAGGSSGAVVQEELLRLAPHLEMACLRHRDLSRREALESRIAEADESLLALYDSGFDLSGRTQEEVARKVIGLACARMELDRAGIFLRQGALLRGAWGMDQEGRIVPIDSTVFDLFPDRDEELTEAAQIVRGDLPFFLTKDLDAEGRASVEGDIGASVSVPMRLGHRIVGVLAADTYYSRRPIRRQQLAPLRILANQAAVALENARLYAEVRAASQDLEARIAARTQELARANDDKDLLLREVHHRTKNNLQLVISLLNLQGNRLDDDQGVKALQECALRVQAMAMIHEDLYAGGDLKAVDFAQQLHKLVSVLFNSYRVTPGSIKLQLEADYLHLSMDAAIPLSLIVNELVTNCLKYAFPTDRPGTLQIGLRIVGEDVELEISDDGIGLPEGFELAAATSMGLQIVAALVGQLHGRIQTCRRSRGTCYCIHLPGLAQAGA